MNYLTIGFIISLISLVLIIFNNKIRYDIINSKTILGEGLRTFIKLDENENIIVLVFLQICCILLILLDISIFIIITTIIWPILFIIIPLLVRILINKKKQK